MAAAADAAVAAAADAAAASVSAHAKPSNARQRSWRETLATGTTHVIHIGLRPLAAEGGDRPVYAMEWAAKEGVVPLATYPYTPRTGDCQAAFDSRKVAFAGAQVVDLSKPNDILQVSA